MGMNNYNAYASGKARYGKYALFYSLRFFPFLLFLTVTPFSLCKLCSFHFVSIYTITEI